MIDPSNILKIGVDFWSSQILLCAVSLDIFTELSEGPLSLADLIEVYNLRSRAARDFFDALTALGFLQKEQDEYSNTEDTDYFLDRNKKTYLGGILGLEQYDMWGNLLPFLKGEFTNVSSTDSTQFYRNLYKDSEKMSEYARSMTSLNLGDHITIAEKFDWSSHKTIVDLGCAEGGLLAQILEKNNGLYGIGMDLPELKQSFQREMKNFGLLKRSEFIPGDFLNEEIPKADIYTMGHIIHAFQPVARKDLLSKIYHLLPENGVLLIYEHVVDDGRKNAFSLMMSLNMQIESGGDGSLTNSEFEQLLKEIGFKTTDVHMLIGPSVMITGIK